MEIKETTNKQEWENFVSSQQTTSVLQSRPWRELMLLENMRPLSMLIQERDEIVAATLVARINLPLGKYYLYSPRGPIFKTGLESFKKEKILVQLASYLRSKYPKAMFWRVDPAITPGELNFHRLGFGKSTRETQPKQTLVLNLRQPEEYLLSQMKPKTRYNIKLAQKKNVDVVSVNNESGLKVFYDLLQKTAAKDGFHTHPYKHYLNIWQALYPSNLRLYLANHNHKSIAAIMVANYANTSVYLHGASDYEYRSIMAPYLLHWYAIREAKRNGYSFYDFWGVAPQKSQSHPWAGITRFKEGFGGEYQEYAGAYDFIFNIFWYKFYVFLRRLRERG